MKTPERHPRLDRGSTLRNWIPACAGMTALFFLLLGAPVWADATSPAPATAKPLYTINWSPINNFSNWLASIPSRIFSYLDSLGQRWIIVFTRDPFSKAERSLTAANDKLDQATAAVSQTDSPAVLGLELLQYLNRYSSFTDIAVARIRELSQQNPSLEYQQLLQTYSLQQLKNQQALRTLAKDAGDNAAAVNQARERGLTQFVGILSDLDPNEITKIIKNATLSATDISDLLAALDTLKEVQQKLPTTLRSSIAQAQKDMVQRLLKESTTSNNPLLQQALPRLQQILQGLH